MAKKSSTSVVVILVAWHRILDVRVDAAIVLDRCVRIPRRLSDNADHDDDEAYPFDDAAHG